MADSEWNRADIRARAVQRFINRLKADLWPETDDLGLARYQVNSMEMTVTESGGQRPIVTLRLEPGANGLQEIWH